ncbi:catecholate siderophore receptor Fiu [Steroidobacter agaridevorans]|uniref:catecholate siderophore receptor Fiu n=1 Tax=Steroidobacter agaridevorans TaxID=2695856 RepID=UPI00132607B6|nr:catecholate siderophore receptor Fiu [Steroidobacter agaridevorans]GFE86140.1 catecholate siderophore receptor Fiu [Steroidobacter agaridevorans]
MRDSIPGTRGSALAAAIFTVLQASALHAAEDPPQSMRKISVEGTEEAAKVDEVSSPKFTQPLLDTPQTIAVISGKVLQQQQSTTLSQALRNTPGVTFLLGENGNTATGDSIFMRGFDTQGSIFIDGIRDLGTISRDTFNTEQVEVAKGPSGPDNGRGAASGYINLATKVPLADNFSRSTVSYGTADNSRITGDLNQYFAGAGAALRLNAMVQHGGVDGRDHVERNSWAIAPSLALGLDSDTRAYFYLLHTKQDNRPDGGIPTIGLDGFFNAAFAPGGANSGLRPGKVDRDNFYGALSDFDDVEGTMFTARIEHDFNDNLRLRNTSRYGKSEQSYLLTGVNAITATDPDPDAWTVSRSRQAKFQENTVLTNQTNLTATFQTGALEHSLTSGLEFIYEKQFNPTYIGQGTMAPAGSAANANLANLYNPNPRDPITGRDLARNGVYTKGDTTTVGAYLFDTISFAERWEVTGGIRLDDYTTQFESATLSTATTHPTLPVGTLVPTDLESSDTLFAYKVGVLYKPRENGSVYLSYATSQQPPGGNNFTLSTATTGNNAVNNPNVDPQKSSNVELGAKWDLNDGAFAVTGAIFRSENENDLVQNDPTDPSAIQQLGKKRVQGIELGVVGRVTDAWELSAGVAKLDTEVLEGTAAQNGAQINWSPELTFTSWTTYQLPFGLTIGGGVRYVDTVFRSISNNITGTTNTPEAPDYWVVDAMLSYVIGEHLTVQLNGYNLADELYVASLNNGGSRYSPGAPRSALLSFSVDF